MRRLLVDDATVVVTMDGARREIPGGAVLVNGEHIERVGTAAEVRGWMAAQEPPLRADRRLDARGMVVLPGLVNCHHHLFQTLTRAVGTAEGLGLFEWLRRLYPLWGRMDSESVYTASLVGLAELLLGGATTVADHLYLYPNDVRLDDTLRAARELGVRFHATRGAMCLGESAGGLPPDALCEDEEEILEDCERVLGRFHDPRPLAMNRIGIAPCSPFSVSTGLMREAAALARAHPGVRLHTHLAETHDERRYCIERFGCTPVEYMDGLGWLAEDAWFAHAVHLQAQEIARFAATGSSVCHCPSSNMILASGIAPVRELLDAGVAVGLGVDGSASNDGNHLLGEARQAMLLARVGWPGFESSAGRLSAREALELATLGGARVLGRNDIGALEQGRAADLVGFPVDDLAHAGALSDPVGALLTCTPGRVGLSVIAGRVVVEEGKLLGVELPSLLERHRRSARRLLAAAH